MNSEATMYGTVQIRSKDGKKLIDIQYPDQRAGRLATWLIQEYYSPLAWESESAKEYFLKTYSGYAKNCEESLSGAYEKDFMVKPKTGDDRSCLDRMADALKGFGYRIEYVQTSD